MVEIWFQYSVIFFAFVMNEIGGSRRGGGMRRRHEEKEEEAGGAHHLMALLPVYNAD